MKNRNWPIFLLLLIVTLLGLRAGWKISTSKAGWLSHIQQWKNIPDYLIGQDVKPLGDCPPGEQATFWLDVIQNHESAIDDPETAMGAAWLLDAPQSGYVKDHFHIDQTGKALVDAGLPAVIARQLDFKTLTALNNKFEALSRETSQSLIEKALQLDPTNPEMRRVRALLLFHNERFSSNFSPRSENWRQILEECSQADPDNALYDLLAALFLWKSSASSDYVNGKNVVNVHDHNLYDEAEKRFTAGLEKSQLIPPPTTASATLKFLSKTSVSPLDALTAAEAVQTNNRLQYLLIDLMRWKIIQANAAEDAGQTDEAIKAAREILAIHNLIPDSTKTPSLQAYRHQIERTGFAVLNSIYRDDPKLAETDEAKTIADQYANAAVEYEILTEAHSRIASRKNLSGSDQSDSTDQNTWWNFTLKHPQTSVLILVLVFAPVAVVTCLFLTLAFFLLSLFFKPYDSPNQAKLSRLRHVKLTPNNLRSRCQAVASSTLMTGLLLMAAYLACLPTGIDAGNKDYLARHSNLVTPGEYWKKLEQEIAVVKAEEETITRIQEKVAERHRQLDEQAAWERKNPQELDEEVQSAFD